MHALCLNLVKDSEVLTLVGDPEVRFDIRFGSETLK